MASNTPSWHTDWNKCCICQTDKKEELTSPLANPTKRVGDGYTLLGKNIPRFNSINEMPIKLYPARLDDGSGIEKTLMKNKAQYHVSCRLLFNNTKLERAEKRSAPAADRDEKSSSSSKIQRRTPDPKNSECFLCEEEGDNLSQAMTMKLNKKINECATTLNDGKLLAKLSAGDVVAQDMKYHPTCLAALYNRKRAYLNTQRQKETEEVLQGKEAYPMAFSEMLTYINEMKTASLSGPLTFLLSELCGLYKDRLEQLGIDSPEVHATRLKEQLLFHIPELEAHRAGRDVVLAFKKDVGAILEQASKYGEAIHLAKAAGMIRRDMLQHKSQFNSTFHDGCLEQAVPASLLQFVCMIEHGADIKSQLQHGASKSDLAMSQLLQYNCFAKSQKGTQVHRHSKDRETPFPVYVGMSVFAKTRKRQLIEMLHENGLSISYDRVLEISTQLGEAVVAQYVEDGVVCPPVLRKHVFTTSAVDNIDHNPTSTTAKSSFHGTSLSLFQHPSSDSPGEERVPLKLSTDVRVHKVPELPDAFTNVQPAYITKNPNPAVVEAHPYPAPESIHLHLKQEYNWLEEVFLTETVGDEVSITWAAHHAAQKRGLPFEVSITSLLPLLRDQAHSVATIKHAMKKIQETVAFLNPGQIPVIVADQPLFALAKQIQWLWVMEYGEDNFVIMFGGLHIEMAGLKSLGTLLEGSGWTSAITEAGVASSGTAESFLTASSVTRTRQAHQITACSLYALMKEAYQDYCSESQESGRPTLTFEDWRDERGHESPQFQFWNLVLDMELTIFLLIRSLREGDFELYREALSELIPYFFANNNVNYARWLPIHLRDMMSLDQQHPEVAMEFHKGNFVVHKSRREFSALALDQAHEQNNAVIKGDGGAIGLTEDPGALRRWMVAGPEVSRLVAGYQAMSCVKDATITNKHHEQTPSAQRSFLEKKKALQAVMKEMGNPFQEESADLLVLDTKNIADPALAELVGTHHERGKEQFQSFMEGLQNEGECSFYHPIKRNKAAFFKHEQAARSSKEKVLKDDCQLFSRMFISCQVRQCDLHDFFKHENQSAPASLSDNGKLHTCQKSQLAEILQAQVTLPDREPEGDAIIIDGSALIHAMPPRSTKSFDDYAREDILPKVESYGAKYERVDIVFDVYKKASLKSETRSKRGKGIRRRVTGRSKTPTNWRGFLRDDNNKAELFHFLAEKMCEVETRSTVIVTRGDVAISNKIKSLDAVAPCSHEEADTRMFVHARDATLQGSQSLVIKANDTDVLVIAISTMPSLQELGLESMWLAFGQGATARWIPVHEVVLAMGPEKVSGILYFHAFTGCDVVSGFRGKGKKSAWQTWNVCDDVSETFAKLSHCPGEVSDDDLQKLEHFVVLLYDRSSAATGVDEARLDLFARKQRSYDAIPPTRAALMEHAKRAAYQGGIIWGQATVSNPDTGSPANWGWTQTAETWQVCWTTIPPIATSCQELTKCSCKKGCTRKCKCFNLGLSCTALCSCLCEQ
eukprot:TRINITY_DN4240_c0_g1_i3.p1 TRINITY_DN4240_c0_g1~~TRINITY_DN4240_c0_g1_i3.p1  ORF type:complete len:1496 (-),score=398.92 TRINITY_DN4240_c0_g1_i3:837-5324(-)